MAEVIVEAVREDEGRAGGAAGVAVAGTDGGEEVFDGAGAARDGGPGLAGVHAAVVIGAAGEGFAPGLGVRGGEAVAIGELVDFRGGEGAEDEGGGVAEEAVAQAVEALEVAEEEDELLEVRGGEFVVEAMERVRDGVGELLLREVGLEVEDVFAQALELGVLRLAQAPDEDVDGAAVFGEVGGDLLAEEDAGAIGDLEAAVDGVVVGEGDEIHAARPERIVEVAGLGVAGGKAGAAEEPFRRARAVAGVEMEIGFHVREGEAEARTPSARGEATMRLNPKRSNCRHAAVRSPYETGMMSCSGTPSLLAFRIARSNPTFIARARCLPSALSFGSSGFVESSGKR